MLIFQIDKLDMCYLGILGNYIEPLSNEPAENDKIVGKHFSLRKCRCQNTSTRVDIGNTHHMGRDSKQTFNAL